MAELTCSALRKAFDGQSALDGVTATIASGEFVALLGPSGCGKTTLLRLVAGFETPDAGSIRLGERILAGEGRFVAPEDRNIGMVFQSYALWPHMTVAGNISYPLEMRRMSAQERRQRVRQALELTGLERFADRMPAQLSGGQRQRVALARCLVAEPQAVLLDEPLANLDLSLRAAMQQAFADFHTRTKATMLYVTHDQTEALALADRVAVMRNGRICQFAAPEELYDRPANRFVAGFVGDGAVIPVQAAGPLTALGIAVNASGQQIMARATSAAPTHICIRPEDLAIDPDGPIPAQVVACTYQGGRFRLELETALGGMIAHARGRARSKEHIRLRIGQPWAFSDNG
ncbi:ABC transporter ATP-binding protein [Paracoccus aestuariivivens]|uniref:ATP-binding cassette domain-containing protein n=1 Tax=Paracoccus aestuariivivens TaxID=1820333 RepID=A0A6L6J8X3_9RHOB|nr:ABC transporter ATP-binding protein [Paracoccus aestuariivivens]MTH78542.1 ATP-binding cassette domain-containing protein [Paracoccus aestuariivivens]